MSKLLDEVEPKLEVKDDFVWAISLDKTFTVKSCYDKFMKDKLDAGNYEILEQVM